MNGRGMGPRGFRYLTEEEKAGRPKLTRKLLSRIFSYLKPYWPALLLSLLTIILAAVLDVFPSILTGRIIDEGFIGGDFPLLLTLVLLSALVMVLSSLLGLLENYLNTRVSQAIAMDMKNSMYAHLQRMSQRFFTVNKQGDILTRMTGDIGGVQGVISGTLTRTVSNVAVLLDLHHRHGPEELAPGPGRGCHPAPFYPAHQVRGQEALALDHGIPGKTG